MTPWFSALPGIASSLGGLAGLFGKNKKNDASKAGMQYLNKIPGAMSPYYQPYINKGLAASDLVGDQYGQQVSDPGAIYNKLGAGYQESPGYQFKLHQALNAADQASAAGGMLGTPQHQQQNMEVANDIAGADFEKYLQNVLGIYQGGISGEEGTAARGYDASTNFGNALGNNLQSQGQMAYEGANARNMQRNQNLSNLTGGIGSAIGGYNAYNQQQKFLDMLNRFGSDRGV